jgi:hypothetical protein
MRIPLFSSASGQRIAVAGRFQQRQHAQHHRAAPQLLLQPRKIRFPNSSIGVTSSALYCVVHTIVNTSLNYLYFIFFALLLTLISAYKKRPAAQGLFRRP